MSVLLQISDPHFGTEQPAVLAALLRLAREHTPDLVVMSGDITQRARRAQFAAAAAFVAQLAAPATLVLPGNHDIPLFNLAARLFAPYANYRRAFGRLLEPRFESSELLVLGVNTTRPSRHKHGVISAAQIEHVAQQLSGAGAAQLRVVVAHHPVLVTRPEDRINLLRGHAAAVQAWAAAGADLVLGGHIHLPYVRQLHKRFADLQRPLWAVQAGTAVSTRVRGDVPNSVNLIRYTAATRHCVVERWDHSGGTHRFEQVVRTELVLDGAPQQP